MVSLLQKRDAAFAEAKAAALVLAVLHVFAFALMMGYRLHTQRYYLSQAAIAEELSSQLLLETTVAAPVTTSPPKVKAKPKPKPKKKKEKKPKPPKVPKPKPKPEPEINPLEQFEAPLERLTHRLGEAHNLLESQTEVFHRYLSRINKVDRKRERLENAMDERESELADLGDTEAAPSNPDMHHWRDLLSIGSLREIPTEHLESMFSGAMREFMEVLRAANNDRKQGNREIRRFLFDTGLGSGIPKESSVFACPVPSAANIAADLEEIRAAREELRQKLLEDAAYEADLEDYLDEFEEVFGNRIQANGIKALSPESVTKLEREINDKLWVVFDDIAGLADNLEDRLEEEKAKADRVETKDDRNDRLASCIDRDLVSELVAEGLKAQTAHTDVREALRKTIARLGALGSGDDELILDADLGAASSSGMNHQHSGSGSRRRMKPIHLRTMIDTPLLMKSIDWIDVLIDAIGGYNDELDSYLDNLTGFHGTASVGEIVVEQLLEQAGRVGEIDAQRFVDEVQSTVRDLIGTK